MPHKLKVSLLAQKELLESAQWYEYHSFRLGDKFADVINDALKIILQAPESFNKTRAEYREYVVNRFPFVIVYKYSGNTVEILHFFHTSRNPKLKYKKQP